MATTATSSTSFSPVDLSQTDFKDPNVVTWKHRILGFIEKYDIDVKLVSCVALAIIATVGLVVWGKLLLAIPTGFCAVVCAAAQGYFTRNKIIKIREELKDGKTELHCAIYRPVKLNWFWVAMHQEPKKSFDRFRADLLKLAEKFSTLTDRELGDAEHQAQAQRARVAVALLNRSVA